MGVPKYSCASPSILVPVGKFVGLLEEIALKATRVFKKEGKVV